MSACEGERERKRKSKRKFVVEKSWVGGLHDSSMSIFNKMPLLSVTLARTPTLSLTHTHAPIHSHTLFHPFSFLQHTWHIHFREIQKIGTGGVKDGKFFSVENVGAMKLLFGSF